jgi:hypothetical protein
MLKEADACTILKSCQHIKPFIEKKNGKRKGINPPRVRSSKSSKVQAVSIDQK